MDKDTLFTSQVTVTYDCDFIFKRNKNLVTVIIIEFFQYLFLFCFLISHFLGYFGSLSSYAFCCSEDSCHFINECIHKNQRIHYIAKEKLSFGKRNKTAQILTFDFKGDCLAYK